MLQRYRTNIRYVKYLTLLFVVTLWHYVKKTINKNNHKHPFKNTICVCSVLDLFTLVFYYHFRSTREPSNGSWPNNYFYRNSPHSINGRLLKFLITFPFNPSTLCRTWQFFPSMTNWENDSSLTHADDINFIE